MAKKSPVKNKPAKSAQKSVTSRLSLKHLNLGAGIVLLVEAVALVLISNSYKLPVVSQYLGTDTLASKSSGSTVLAPAAHRLFDVNVAYALAVVAVIAGLLAVAMATVWQKNYDKAVKAATNKYHWLNVWVVGGLSVLSVAFLVGVSDIALLLGVFALVEITALFALLLEAQPEVGKNHPRVANKIAFVSSVTPWLVIGLYLLGAQLFSEGSLPSYLYWLAGSILLLAALMASVMYKHAHGKGKWADSQYSEKAYVVLSFVMVSALLWQVYFGALR